MHKFGVIMPGMPTVFLGVDEFEGTLEMPWIYNCRRTTTRPRQLYRFTARDDIRCIHVII